MIIVAIDYATCWVEVKALPNGNVAQFIVEQIIFRHRAPRVLLSNRGKSLDLK